MTVLAAALTADEAAVLRTLAAGPPRPVAELLNQLNPYPFGGAGAPDGGRRKIMAWGRRDAALGDAERGLHDRGLTCGPWTARAVTAAGAAALGGRT